MFVEIPADFLSRIATDSDRVPRLYYSPRWAVRRFFWMRLRLIHGLIRRHQIDPVACLDFGGGGGVMLPTLSSLFRNVVCIDLENAEAVAVVRHYTLPNVRLVKGDIASATLAEAPFDAIVAADVLEHFPDLRVPVDAIRRWMAPGGLLYTSLPTETWLYRGLRRIFGITKPEDHFHTGFAVEQFLARHGFRRMTRRYVPLLIGLAPLFLVTAWRYEPGTADVRQ